MEFDSDVPSGVTYISHSGEVQNVQPGDVVIAVMGESGSGKSTFISNFNDHVVIRDDEIGSATDEVTAFEATVNGKRVFLVDTIGFDVTHQGETYGLNKLVAWLDQADQSGVSLTGIIYLYNIQNPRVQGPDLHELLQFQKRCGGKALPPSSVALATTFWDMVADYVDEAEAREWAFQKWFWNDADGRIPVQRLVGGNPEEAAEIVEWLVRNVPGAAINKNRLLVRGEEDDMDMEDVRQAYEERLMTYDIVGRILQGLPLDYSQALSAWGLWCVDFRIRMTALISQLTNLVALNAAKVGKFFKATVDKRRAILKSVLRSVGIFG